MPIPMRFPECFTLISFKYFLEPAPLRTGPQYNSLKTLLEEFQESLSDSDVCIETIVYAGMFETCLSVILMRFATTELGQEAEQLRAELRLRVTSLDLRFIESSGHSECTTTTATPRPRAPEPCS